MMLIRVTGLVILVCGALGVIEINDTNSELLFQDSWMVMFYAPWCPACEALREPWVQLSHTFRDEGLQSLSLAVVDVQKYPEEGIVSYLENRLIIIKTAGQNFLPEFYRFGFMILLGISGQFLIFNLPSFYRIDDNLCRHYIGLNDPSAIKSWILNGDWERTDPVPNWRAPNSLLLQSVGQFFRFASSLRSLKTTLTDEYSIPYVLVYLIFFATTIVIGLLAGLIVVCICDCLFPPKRQKDTHSVAETSSASDGNQESAIESKSTTIEPRAEEDEQPNSKKGGVRRRKKSRKS